MTKKEKIKDLDDRIKALGQLRQLAEQAERLGLNGSVDEILAKASALADELDKKLKEP